jgi:hypothetical protein
MLSKSVLRPRRWVAIAVVGAVAFLPLVAGEVRHVARYGHIACGIHADARYDSTMDFGIPGVSGAYSVRLVNLTPVPLLARACLPPSDTSYRPLVFRYQVERWQPAEQHWDIVLGLKPGDCTPFPLVRTVLWPGVPVDGVGWEATAARKGIHKGDRVRFTVFTVFERPDDSLLQLAATTQDVTILEEGPHSGQYRVAH